MVTKKVQASKQKDATVEYSYTEKKRIRKSFGKYPETIEVPYLLLSHKVLYLKSR